jgi:hypothetical protein
VNQFIYEEIANLRSYVIISAALLLATIFSVNDSVISVYGQQSTANKSVLQNNSGLKSSESGQLLTTYGPTANDLDTLKEKQSGTTVVESKEQQKQGTDEETLNLFKADDNDISTELQSSTGLQSEKPQNKEGQNREDQQEFGEDEGNEDGSNKADGGEDEGNEDGSNKADGGEEDASGKEKDDDIPFELPFP